MGVLGDMLVDVGLPLALAGVLEGFFVVIVLQVVPVLGHLVAIWSALFLHAFATSYLCRF
jgi:hypothetical protein